MRESQVNWDKKHIVKISSENFSLDDDVPTESKEWRNKIEPWLTAIFQSEHLSLLAGTGLSAAVTTLAGTSSPGMGRIVFDSYENEIRKWADSSAKRMDRGQANIEDDLRAALELLVGLQIQGDSKKAESLKTEIDNKLYDFIKSILKTENAFISDIKKSEKALNYLKSFLISFASRTATRDRLQIFTTNYDRFIEYGCDMAGLFTLDRFVGKIKPQFRTSKLELDYHYNPPGIRGEPRYVEGVVRIAKIHGSIDWRFENGQIYRVAIPFGAGEDYPSIPEKASDHVVIYPNSSKGIDTAFYPYSELFRDFASAVCRPNSVVITYGYGFGDSHINRILKDMLTIPSTHLVIISYDDASGRLKQFYHDKNSAQFTLLIGSHFGDLSVLVDEYLPKAAIDRLTEKMRQNMERRGIAPTKGIADVEGQENEK